MKYKNLQNKQKKVNYSKKYQDYIYVSTKL